MTSAWIASRKTGGKGGPSEDRHHLLSDLWRVRRGRDRARYRARSEKARGALHHVSAALSPAVVPAPDLLPRGGRRALSALRIPAIRPRAGGSHARGREVARARSAPRALRDPARDERVDRARDAP